MYSVKFHDTLNSNRIILSVVKDASHAFIMPWMPIPVSQIVLTQVVSGTSTDVAKVPFGTVPNLKHLALTVQGTTAKVYFRGRLIVSATLGTTMSISRVELLGGNQLTLLSEMMLAPHVATAETIAMWDNLRAPFYDPNPVIPDSQIPSSGKWDKGVADATKALADAADAKATADGKVTTFYQDTEPEADGLGDLWVNTFDGKKLHRWDGDAWVLVQDEGIQAAVQAAQDAQATADGKIVTFYQSSTPTAGGIGDLWVDTGNSNHLYRWDGTAWRDAQDTSDIDTSKRKVHTPGLGGYIEQDGQGMRFIRHGDNKNMIKMDTETGSAEFGGELKAATGTFAGDISAASGTFSGRLEAEEGFFRGDVTGATGEFHGSLKARSIKAGWYEDIRNVLPYTGQDSLDSDKPIVIPFYIPSETTNIVAAFVSAEARRYRAYSKSAPYDVTQWWNQRTGGVATFGSSPVTVTYDENNSTKTGSTGVDHVHRYKSGPGSYDYDYTERPRPNSYGSETNLSHDHTYSRVSNIKLNNFNNHVHDYDPSHDHPLEFGIHEDTTPASVRMRVHNGTSWSSYITLASAPSGNAAYDLISGASVPKHNNNASEMDLTSYLSGTGWKHIEFSSSRLGLIAWNIILKLDITA